jgi:hypothetical protein
MILAVGGTGKPGRRVARRRRELGHEMRYLVQPNPEPAKLEVGHAGVGARRGGRSSCGRCSSPWGLGVRTGSRVITSFRPAAGRLAGVAGGGLQLLKITFARGGTQSASTRPLLSAESTSRPASTRAARPARRGGCDVAEGAVTDSNEDPGGRAGSEGILIDPKSALRVVERLAHHACVHAEGASNPHSGAR